MMIKMFHYCNCLLCSRRAWRHIQTFWYIHAMLVFLHRNVYDGFSLHNLTCTHIVSTHAIKLLICSQEILYFSVVNCSSLSSRDNQHCLLIE